jgi:hypothetical protein
MFVESKLEEAFVAYLNLANAKLYPRPVDPSRVVPFELVKNSSLELRHLFEELEPCSEFGHLVKQTLLAYPCSRDDWPLPTREALLSVLNLDSGNRATVKQLLKTLPADFPSTSDWLSN